jgi:hypothetical protein
MVRTWCKYCDSDGFLREGEVIVTKDKSDDWDHKRRWGYSNKAVDPVYRFDFNPDCVVSSATYEP